MNVFSLFSGIGGLDLGLERAGMTVVGQVEIDPWCRTILAKHWPEVPRHDDVRTAAAWWDGHVADTKREPVRMRPGSVDAPAGTMQGETQQRQRVRTDAGDGGASSRHGDTRASRGRPAVDVVAGGFPCQPVSLAGKGLAQADSRWLWPPTRDVIRHLRPRWVLLENVPGLLGRGMGDVLGDLAACGYDAEWDCVPACFVGAPHIRNRVFIVAYPASERFNGRPGIGGTGWHSAIRRETVGHARDRDSSPDLADGDGGRLAEQSQRDGWAQPRIFGAQRDDAQRRSVRAGWPAEPGVGRVAHGIPRRVDRLRGLGNAVVPAVAEHVGRLIMDAAA